MSNNTDSTGAGGQAGLSHDDMVEMAIRAELQGLEVGYLGPFILGFSFDFIMCGIMLGQILLWSHQARSERRFVQVIVCWVTLVSLASTVYGIWYMFDMFALNFGVYSNFIKMDKITTYGILDPLILVPVQIFYVERAYRIMKNAIWVVLVSLPCIALGMTGAIGTKIAADQVEDLLEYTPADTALWIYLWIAGSLAVDLFLTTTIALGLSRSKTGWSQTDALINRVIRASFETSLPGTLTFLAFLIMNTVVTQFDLPVNGITFFVIVHPKVHVLSLMAVLNYRLTLRRAMGENGTMLDSSTQKRGNTFAISNRHQQETIHLDRIQVDTHTYAESHQLPEVPLGINRKPVPNRVPADMGDTDSISLSLGKDDDLEEGYGDSGNFNSTTRLNEPSVSVLMK